MLFFQIYLGEAFGEKKWITPFLWQIINHKKPSLFLSELIKHVYGDLIAYRCLNLSISQLNIKGLKEMTPEKLSLILSKYFAAEGALMKFIKN